MNRHEFEALRDVADKRIAADIVFQQRKETSPNLTFDEVVVENRLGFDVVLNGTYKPALPAVTFNFVLRGVGPICRVCVNGTIHRGAGRTHKHDLRHDDDTKGHKNLPEAVARPDLEGRSAREVWETLCRQANIVHSGAFVDPEE